MGERLTIKGHQEILGDDKTVLQLHIFVTSQNCTLKTVNFVIYKLYFNKPEWEKNNSMDKFTIHKKFTHMRK